VTADGTIAVLDVDANVWFSDSSDFYDQMLREVSEEEASITEKTVPPEEE
jgi:hypothetical protein